MATCSDALQPDYIPFIEGKTNQWDQYLFEAILQIYPPQMMAGLRLRADIDRIGKDQPIESVLALIRKVFPTIRPMFELSTCTERLPPDGVVPSVANVLDTLWNQEAPPVYQVDKEYAEEQDILSVILDGHFGVVCKEYRQYTKLQTLLTIFLMVACHTVLLANKHGCNASVSWMPFVSLLRGLTLPRLSAPQRVARPM